MTREWYFEDYIEELDHDIENLKQELDADFDKETELGMVLMKQFKENSQFMIELLGLIKKIRSDFARDILCKLSKKPEQTEGLDATETKTKSDNFTFAVTMSHKNLTAEMGMTRST
ncbi:hypothetical protein N0V86_009251 [Didymella sp. IMI 355093]|nr:hypothetical protein N0V86_009251 [Didymella sp. IMI 355093]